MQCVREQDTALLQDNHAAAQQVVAIVKHKHWSGVSDVFSPRSASVLE